ncbi:DUF1499 domain-containing protein [Shimia sp. R9_2]|uniref:DUF1499 domain-containing protein n=1 Tax=Shimia sp. R9_2 TaxID=2821112 RepID=UPI001AD9554E|nr:DUF1499 domain-containing protein [Shimia sp. R9_2]MBO9396172.1 DUF1499 domain-containing protein [Shimia sp. R9_2]
MSYIWVFFAVVALLAVYVRVAPSDPTKWHVAAQFDQNSDGENSARRIVDTGPDGLTRLNEIALSTPRTTVLAGALEDGMITYVTRSKLLSYPDYTTAQQVGDTLKINARSRFGKKDFGVNAKRIEAWIAALGQRG